MTAAEATCRRCRPAVAVAVAPGASAAPAGVCDRDGRRRHVAEARVADRDRCYRGRGQQRSRRGPRPGRVRDGDRRSAEVARAADDRDRGDHAGDDGRRGRRVSAAAVDRHRRAAAVIGAAAIDRDRDDRGRRQSSVCRGVGVRESRGRDRLPEHLAVLGVFLPVALVRAVVGDPVPVEVVDRVHRPPGGAAGDRAERRGGCHHRVIARHRIVGGDADALIGDAPLLGGLDDLLGPLRPSPPRAHDAADAGRVLPGRDPRGLGKRRARCAVKIAPPGRRRRRGAACQCWYNSPGYCCPAAGNRRVWTGCSSTSNRRRPRSSSRYRARWRRLGWSGRCWRRSSVRSPRLIRRRPCAGCSPIAGRDPGSCDAIAAGYS